MVILNWMLPTARLLVSSTLTVTVYGAAGALMFSVLLLIEKYPVVSVVVKR